MFALLNCIHNPGVDKLCWRVIIMGSKKYSLLSLVTVLITRKRFGSDMTACSHFILFGLSNVMM